MTTENTEIDLKKIVEIVTPFDDDPVGDKFEYEPLLNEIQGNIIKSHGRNHAVYLFLKFNDNIEAAKEWIGNFSHRYVTSALEQAEQGKLYRENKDVPGTIFANFFLTRAGYMHLGYTYEQLPSEDSFRQGMQDPNMQNELGDDSQQWEPGFQNEIHALVLLAADRIVGPRTQEAKRKEQQQKTDLLVKVPALLALKVEKMHRIARRAINYGPLPSEEPEKDAGLLFMCFQASLTNQFNFMQKAWAKEQNFVKPDVGTDVVIGVEKTDDGGEAMEETYNWPTQWGAAGKTEATFDHWVTMRGGEFFFAPSMSFLKSLAPEPSRNEITQDIDACEYKMAELKEYKALNWAIGLNGDTLEPDGFVKFFDERNLPFEYYVRSQGVSQGDDSAYEKNITTLKNYITQLGDA